MELKQLIKTLSDLRGISGFEYRINDKIEEIIKEYADEVYKDALGNVIAVLRCGKGNAKSIMIEAHLDEIGLMVTGIDERGFITFTSVGGVDERILPSLEVTIHGKEDIAGIIGAKPPHLQTADENKKSIKMSDMAIDVGMSEKEVKKIVSIGDSITFSQSCGELSKDSFSGKCLDDRAGVAAIITTLKNLKKSILEVDVYAVIAVQEEVGLRGSKVSAYGINPDMAVAIDVCHAITPDNSKDAFESGEGVVVTVGPNIHPKLAKRLLKTADEYNIKIDIEAEGGQTGTDAWSIQTVRSGVATALLSIPLKYMHTNVETLSIKDVKATSDLLTFFIQNLDDNTEEWLCF